MRNDIKTKVVRLWWWWLNPWLYIKRRDVAYDMALDTLYELCLDAKYPERKHRTYSPPGVVLPTMKTIASRCPDCGRDYMVGIVEDNQ